MLRFAFSMNFNVRKVFGVLKKDKYKCPKMKSKVVLPTRIRENAICHHNAVPTLFWENGLTRLFFSAIFRFVRFHLEMSVHYVKITYILLTFFDILLTFFNKTAYNIFINIIIIWNIHVNIVLSKHIINIILNNIY